VPLCLVSPLGCRARIALRSHRTPYKHHKTLLARRANLHMYQAPQRHRKNLKIRTTPQRHGKTLHDTTRRRTYTVQALQHRGVLRTPHSIPIR
jgi:hypothetical protein